MMQTGGHATYPEGGVALPERDGASLEEVAGCFGRWNAQSLTLKATNFRDRQGSLLAPPSN